MTCRVVIGILLLLLLGGARSGAADRSFDTLADCEQAVARERENLESWRCFLRVARLNRDWQTVSTRLEELLADEAQPYRGQLFLGVIQRDLGNAESVAILQQAVAGAERAADARAEVFGRLELRFNLTTLGQIDQASEQLLLAQAAADRAGDQELDWTVRIQRAWQAVRETDYGQAINLIESVEQTLGTSTAQWIYLDLLEVQGAAHWGGGYFDRAAEAYERALAVLGSEQIFRQATILNNLVLMNGNLYRLGLVSEAELFELLNRAYDMAISSGNKSAEAQALIALASYQPDYYEQGITLFRERGQLRNLAYALLRHAGHRSSHDLDAAMENAREAYDLSVELEDLRLQLNAAAVLASLAWEAEQFSRGRVMSLASIDAVERFRASQPEPMTRLQVASRFSSAYREFAQRLLANREQLDGDVYAEVFSVMERFRNGLYDGETREIADDVDADRLKQEQLQVLLEIAEVQSGLISGWSQAAERDDGLERLDALEETHALLRDALSRRKIVEDLPERTLADLQESLKAHEAFLLFVQESDPSSDSSGSWLVAITQQSVRSYNLGLMRRLSTRIRLLPGLIARRDGAEIPQTVDLYRTLLQEAIGELPSEISHLVLVPDGIFHRVPFGLLQASPGEPALAQRFTLSRAQSASLWLRDRGKPASPDGRSLVLADPSLPFEGRGDGFRGAGVFAAPNALEGLPFARREAQKFKRALTRGTQIQIGQEATESLLKDTAKDYEVLYFAAHALIDDLRPERSAIVLASDAGEDGLFQFREVLDLELNGPLVVLSVCDSAEGALRSGAGATSLSNAFMRAGARSIVASLWPLRDDEAEQIFSEFGRQLSTGQSVSESLAAARRIAIKEGMPPASWGGLVVIGDGEHRPFAGSKDLLRPISGGARLHAGARRTRLVVDPFSPRVG